MTDFHRIVRQKHLVGDGLCDSGLEGDESRGGVLIVSSHKKHLQSTFYLDSTTQSTPKRHKLQIDITTAVKYLLCGHHGLIQSLL